MSVGTLVPVASKPGKNKENLECSAEVEAAALMVRQARERGLALTGLGGLLKQFTKTVLETALNEEMTEHLGREKHAKALGGRAPNARNGTTEKTVLTDSVGPVETQVPRDRDGSFEPVIMKKRQCCLNDVDEVAASLYVKGVTSSLTPSSVKVRDGQVANRAFYAAIGVSLDGTRDVLGIWVSPGSEGAKYWLSVGTDLKTGV